MQKGCSSFRNSLCIFVSRRVEKSGFRWWLIYFVNWVFLTGQPWYRESGNQVQNRKVKRVYQCNYSPYPGEISQA